MFDVKDSVLDLLSASYLAYISYNTCLISRLDVMAIDKEGKLIDDPGIQCAYNKNVRNKKHQGKNSPVCMLSVTASHHRNSR